MILWWNSNDTIYAMLAPFEIVSKLDCSITYKTMKQFTGIDRYNTLSGSGVHEPVNSAFLIKETLKKVLVEKFTIYN